MCGCGKELPIKIVDTELVASKVYEVQAQGHALSYIPSHSIVEYHNSYGDIVLNVKMGKCKIPDNIIGSKITVQRLIYVHSVRYDVGANVYADIINKYCF